MAVATFDTLKYANSLKAAGVPEKQAEAQSAALSELLFANLKEVASKEQVESFRAELKRDIVELRSELKRDLEDLKTELHASIVEVRTELSSRMDLTTTKLESQIQQLASRIDKHEGKISGDMALLKWMTGVVALGVLTTLARLFLFRPGSL